MAKLNDMRWRWVHSLLLSSIYTAAVIFVIFQIWFLLDPGARNIGLSIFIAAAVFIVQSILGLYYGFRETRALKKRLEDLSAFITVLARGNLSHRMTVSGEDQMGTIAGEMNELADKLQKQVRSLQKLANEKADLAEQARSAATIEERQRLARDLHDVVSQQLFALSMMSSASLKLIDRDKELAKEQMAEVAEMAAKAQGEMRALLLHLRPVHLSGDRLPVGVAKLVEELEVKSGIHFDLMMKEICELPRGIEDHLFRIVQEGLANALRHSAASVIKIELYEREQYVHLHLRDNGIGFDVKDEKKASYGLKTMKERCEEIGGTFSVTSRENEGTAVDVRVPISKEENHDG